MDSKLRMARSEYTNYTNQMGDKQKAPIKTRAGEEILYPELRYVVVGALFSAYNELGPGYREKRYEELVANELSTKGVSFKRQARIDLKTRGIQKPSLDFADFLIEDKIVLELKKGDYLNPKSVDQIYEYLQATGFRLGILAHFSSRGVMCKRILNTK